jgi:hypothetical protein
MQETNTVIEFASLDDVQTRDFAFAAYANALSECANTLEHQAEQRNDRAHLLLESLDDLRGTAVALHHMAASLKPGADGVESELIRKFMDAANFTTADDRRLVAYRLANYLPYATTSKAALLAYFVAVLGPRAHRRKEGRELWRRGMEQAG